MSSPAHFLKDLPTEVECVRALELSYWGAGSGIIRPLCPDCGQDDHVQLPSKKGRLKWFQCRKTECGRQFSLFIGTPFFRSRTPLRKWFEANWYIKRRVRPSEFCRKIGLSNREATRIAQKIRELDVSEQPSLWKVRLRYLKHLKSRGRMSPNLDPLIDPNQYPEPTYMIYKKRKKQKVKKRDEDQPQTTDD